MKPLESDAKRQAIPTLRGYSYQIWQSLLRWLELGENENLFLEGAEDIDVLGPGTAETVQVKETAESGSVTLRSADVLEAVNNFWEHQTKNPQTVIKFRFLTTSERGLERPKEFEKMRGLDFWDSCKREGTANQPLRDFLAKRKEHLSDKLREFIKDASDDDLRQKLLSRFEWDTGRKKQLFVEAVVRRKIVEYGDAAYALPPTESEKTISRLLQHVWEVVRRGENRWLTRADFLTVFEEATTERIPTHELLKLKRAAANAEASKPASGLPIGLTGGLISFTHSPILETLSLPDLSGFAGREKLIAQLRLKLDESDLLFLIGSTVTGKSFLANQIANLIGDRTWQKLDLRGFSPEQIRDRLDYAARVIEDETEQIDCIVDDLNFDRQPHIYENALGRFLYAVNLRGGRVIFTSHHKPPVRIVNYFDLPEEVFFPVPPLGEADVKDLLAKHNCPEGHLLKAWTRLIHLQMRGHALLTHTRVRALESTGWRAPEANDLTITEEIKDVRGEFRRTLREQLPEDERTLLYRLSIFAGRFKRRHALQIGVHSPPISGAGDAFDALVGPWIEPVDATYFRLSPLLDDAASNVFTETQIQDLHRAAAESFLEKVISVTEFNGLLFHGLKGEEIQPLVAAAMSVFSAEESGWQEIARISDWFAYTRMEKGEKLFESDNLVNFLLRRLQFKIMSVIDPKKAVIIADIIKNELNEWDGSGSYSGTKEAITFTFLNDVIFDLEMPFKIKQIAEWVLRIIRYQKEGNSFFPEHPEHQVVLDETLKFLATTTVYVRVATARCRLAAEVIELLTAFDESEDEMSSEVWKEFGTDSFVASTLVDAVWLSESRNEKPDWVNCLKTLDRIAEIAHQNKATALAAAVYQAKAIVYKEYLHDSDAAFKVLEAGETALGESEVFLQDYRAKIYFMEKNYAEAIKIWRQILPRISTDRNAARTFSFRDAEVCAARLGEWGEAAELALRGEEVARLPFIDNQPAETKNNVLGEAVAVSYRADYAFAVWKMGNRAEAVSEFAGVLDSFENLPAPTYDFRVHMLYKRVGYAIGWFNQDVEDGDKFEEPPPGFFSNPETIDEVKETPLQPIKNYWFLLARLEYKLRLGDAVFRRFAEQDTLERGKNANIGYRDLRLKHALAKYEVENLISQYLEFSEALRKFAAQNGTDENWNEAEVLKSLTFTALLLFAGRGQSHLLPLADWRRDAAGAKERVALDESFADWLKLIEKFLVADRTTLIAALARGTVAPEERILAALMISANAEGVDVETRFYANVILLTADYSRDWREETADVIEYWTVNGWKEIAERERFVLQSPNTTAPAILAACADETSRGIGKAANVLLAARPAVKLSIDESALSQLRNLTKES